MEQRPARLSELTSKELENLQHEANELAGLQAFLNKLPLGLQVEKLSDEELVRLRAITCAPVDTLCGQGLLDWNNCCRRHGGLRHPKSEICS